MTQKPRVLFISHEIDPYLKLTEMSKISRALPQGIQESGKEIRTFMPRFGCINERRNQLHEVIRLSGMNLIIDETDHPLVIKVGSIQSARMQVYFIDNEEYFHRKTVFHDSKKKFHKDNDDRMIFFCRGVLETVKKLGWSPDVIHCHGWMSSMVPLFVKTAYSEDPMFKNSKVVYSVYDNDFEECLGDQFAKKVKMNGMTKAQLNELANGECIKLHTSAINHSDAIIVATDKLHADIKKTVTKSNKPVLNHHDHEDYISAYSDFYDTLLEEESVLAS